MKPVRSALQRIARRIVRPAEMGEVEVRRYWDERYASGGSSGDGSYGRLARFKSEVINAEIARLGVRSAVEFGCGDGHQLELIECPSYIGLDISASAISRCIRRFSHDATKSFFVYDPAAFHDPQRIIHGELVLSLDVIYHIVSDSAFERYMTHLSDAATKALIIYSTNTDAAEAGHIRHRNFTDWMALNRPEFRLSRFVPNPYPGVGPQQSNASFFSFERLHEA